MSEYEELDLITLIDLLVKFAKEYDMMLSTRVYDEEEFAHCKNVLAELHATIKLKAKDEGYNTDNIFPNIPDMRTIRQRAEQFRANLRGNKQPNGSH